MTSIVCYQYGEQRGSVLLPQKIESFKNLYHVILAQKPCFSVGMISILSLSYTSHCQSSINKNCARFVGSQVGAKDFHL